MQGNDVAKDGGDGKRVSYLRKLLCLMTLNDINVTFTVLLFSLKRQDMFLYNFICNDVNCFFILILAEILWQSIGR